MDEHYIEQLEQDLELEQKLERTTDGVWTLPFDEEVAVAITDLSPGYSFNALVAEVKGDEEKIYSDLMLANLFFQASEACILGLDAEAKWVTLQRESLTDNNYQQFSDDLEEFLNALDFWRDEIKSSSNQKEDRLL